MPAAPDGRNPLPDEDIAPGCYRDGPARTGLQPHAHHEHYGRPTAAGGDAGIVVADMCQYPVADGKNIKVEYRWAGGDVDSLRSDAASLVALDAEVIVSGGTQAT